MHRRYYWVRGEATKKSFCLTDPVNTESQITFRHSVQYSPFRSHFHFFSLRFYSLRRLSTFTISSSFLEHPTMSSSPKRKILHASLKSSPSFKRRRIQRTVSFSDQVLTHPLPPLSPCRKRAMFYTQNDFRRFKVEEINRRDKEMVASLLRILGA